jgi:ATP-binding cassette, subfamily C (CFTR/MRP), member 1
VARAIYSKKDLVLLDDVMSGLDAGTEDRMFNNLFGENGLFRAIGTTVIYATNGGMYLDVAHSLRNCLTTKVHRLSYAQHIIVLDSEGKIAEQGSYETLSSTTKNAQSAPPEYSESANPTADTDSGKTTILGPPNVQGLDRRAGDSAVYKYYVRTVGWFNFAVFLGSCSLFIFALVFPRTFLPSLLWDP